MESFGNIAAQTRDSVGLCMGCALLHHDYREILGQSTDDDYSSDKALPEAWIDGRRYRLYPDVMAHEMFCSECNGRTPGVYVPTL